LLYSSLKRGPWVRGEAVEDGEKEGILLAQETGRKESEWGRGMIVGTTVW